MIGRIVDVSSNDHNDLPPGAGPPIDWTAAAKAGVTTALVKATEGTKYVNPWYKLDVDGARAAGMQVLAYHFASFTSVAAEAEHFLNTAGELARIGDFETSANWQWARDFLLELGAGPDKLLAYGSASTLKDWYARVPAMAWPAEYPPPGKPPQSPGWGVLWQFTDAAKIPGIPTLCDESKWQGSEIQYDTLFGIYDPPPEEAGVLVAMTSTGKGYWLVKPDGSVYAYGDASYQKGLNNSGPNGTSVLVAGDAATDVAGHGTDGYLISTAKGNLYAFGSAPFLGHP